jgi:hypothetical protein
VYLQKIDVKERVTAHLFGATIQDAKKGCALYVSAQPKSTHYQAEGRNIRGLEPLERY